MITILDAYLYRYYESERNANTMHPVWRVGVWKQRWRHSIQSSICDLYLDYFEKNTFKQMWFFFLILMEITTGAYGTAYFFHVLLTLV